MSKNIQFLDLTAQYPKIREKIQKRFETIIDNSAFIANDNVAEFEEKFAQYSDAKHCIAVNNGTTALMLALMAYDIGTGDEVIVPANTFIATAEAVSVLGATPVLVDMDPKTYLIDAAKIEERITENTKAIIPVHLYGQTADMDAVNEIAEKHNLAVIEDACQAHGASYKGKKAGSLGNIAAFSCYPGKNLGAWGEAGAVTTNDDALAEKMRLITSHGSKIKYHHEVVGANFRINEFQGAVLAVKMDYIEEWNQSRRDNAQMYLDTLADMENIQLPAVPEGNTPVWHLFVIQLKSGDREAFMKHMEDNGVGVGIHYPVPLHMTPAYEPILSYKKGDFPESENAQDMIVSLPMYAELPKEDVAYVCETIKKYDWQ